MTYICATATFAGEDVLLVVLEDGGMGRIDLANGGFEGIWLEKRAQRAEEVVMVAPAIAAVADEAGVHLVELKDQGNPGLQERGYLPMYEDGGFAVLERDGRVDATQSARRHLFSVTYGRETEDWRMTWDRWYEPGLLRHLVKPKAEPAWPPRDESSDDDDF